MSAVSFPVSRPVGRVLVVGSPACRSQPLATLQRLGYELSESDNPYSAMAELCRAPMAYRAVILSLQSLFREELTIINAIKRRLEHIEVWVCQTDGRQALLADAMRAGADGLLADDGLHRLGVAPPGLVQVAVDPPEPPGEVRMDSDELRSNEEISSEPVLTADELRALLQEQPVYPEGKD